MRLTSFAVSVPLLVALVAAQQQDGPPARIFVATGFAGYGDDPDEYYLDEVEVVDTATEPQSACFTPAPYPVGEYGGAGAFIEDSVLVCGGKFGEDNYTDLCFRYDGAADEWSDPGFKLNYARRYSVGIMLSPDEWWVTGGSLSFGDDNLLDVTEIYRAGSGGFVEDVRLPRPMDLHNLFEINSTHLVLLDGRPNEEGPMTWYVDKSTRTFTPTTQPNIERYTAAAGLVRNSQGQAEVVWGGGVTAFFDDYSTEIFNLETEEWRRGPDTPVMFVGTASLPFGPDTFVTVGGSEGGDTGYTPNLFSFDADLEEWTVLPQQLLTARETVVAVAIPAGFVPCSSD